MKQSSPRIVAIAIFLVLLAFIGASCELAVRGASHMPLGMVRLVDAEGLEKKLSDYSAKVVLVNFWASWCVSCLAEMRQLDTLQGHFSRNDLLILGVMIDDVQANLLRAEQSATLHFPLLLDRNSDAKRLFAVSALPTTIALDCRGRSLDIWDSQLKAKSKRIVGAREWDSEENVERVRQLIESRHC